MSTTPTLLPEPSHKPRLGLAWSVTLTFLLLTVVALAINAMVALRLHALSSRGEVGRGARETVRATALMMDGTGDDLSELLRSGTFEAVQIFDARGAEVHRIGEIAQPLDSRAPELLAALRLGATKSEWLAQRSLGEPLLRTVAPIGSQVKPNGALVAWTPVAPAPGAEQARRLSVLYAVLNAVIVGIFGWYLITRLIVRPVRRLTTATRAITAGDLSARVRVDGFGELDSLARDFNRMTGTLTSKLAELEDANRSLRSAREEVVQAEKLASVGRLAAGVAHELGNPVAAVTGYVSMMLRGKDADTSTDTDALRRIDREMKRIDRIIRDLLEYARPRPETIDAVDVEAVLDSALAIVGGQSAFRGIEVAKSLGHPPKVSGDPHRLSQVLVNLLINAADALEGQAVRRIEIRTFEGAFPSPAEPRRRSGEAAPEGPAVGVEVSDTGKGLTDDDRKRMFEPFYTTKSKGTGLGLAISRTIIETMGGRIYVTGEPGKGATFTLLLPPSGSSAVSATGGTSASPT